MIIKLTSKLPFASLGNLEVVHWVDVARIEAATFDAMYAGNDAFPLVDLVVGGNKLRIFGDHKEAVQKAMELAHMPHVFVT